MSDSNVSALRQAMALHQQGDLAGAEARYHAVLQSDPGNVDARHLLGLAALQRGQPEVAVRLIGEAIAAAPNAPHFHNNLGSAERAAGRPEAALRCYDRAIALAPDYAEAFNNRGVALEQLERFAEAVACYDRAVALRPDYADAFYNRGNALRGLRRRVEAVVSYDRAIELRPSYEAALNNRGVQLQALGRREAALASFTAALALRPDNAEAAYNRANILNELGRAEAAVAGYRQAIALRPDYAEAHNNCGNALMALNQPAAALACFDHAATLRPDWAELSNNRGTALLQLNRHEEAHAAYGRALVMRPDYPEARMNRGMCRLAMGDFARGWREYEARWLVPGLSHMARRQRQPGWVDRPASAGGTLLLHAEQGFGDTLQFCRFVALAAARFPVVLEVPRPLFRLMRTLDGPQAVIAHGDDLPAFDLHCPLLSLPLMLGTSLETIPASVPYLHADAAAAAAWQRRLAPLPGLRVGLVWGGRRREEAHATDARRSMALAQFAPLAAVEGLSLVSLQLGEPAAEAHTPPDGLVLQDWTGELDDFADTAALVAGLDLVITVDTAVAHLAGALGREVWILSRFDACWRWLIGREDSPWYPTARLFRQPAPGDWDSVMRGVAAALRARLAGG
jgi:tetratricopeptide (TPR) repeat protein